MDLLTFLYVFKNVNQLYSTKILVFLIMLHYIMFILIIINLLQYLIIANLNFIIQLFLIYVFTFSTYLLNEVNWNKYIYSSIKFIYLFILMLLNFKYVTHHVYFILISLQILSYLNLINDYYSIYYYYHDNMNDSSFIYSIMVMFNIMVIVIQYNISPLHFLDKKDDFKSFLFIND